VCAAAFVDGWIVAMPLGAPPRPFGMPTVANARVLELPMTDDNVNVAAMYRGTHHRLPVVNGYAGYVPPHAVVIEWALRRHDPSVLTELRRGHPLYVAIANNADSHAWTEFMDAQNDAQMIGVTGAGRLYLMPAAPFPKQVTVGAPLDGVRAEVSGDWLQLDFGRVRTARALDLRTRGHFVWLRSTVRVETSLDGSVWTLAAEEPSGGLTLTGTYVDPRGIPVRIVLPDPAARYIRVNAGAFGTSAATVYGP
jgi:hypothetical protein